MTCTFRGLTGQTTFLSNVFQKLHVVGLKNREKFAIFLAKKRDFIFRRQVKFFTFLSEKVSSLFSPLSRPLLFFST